jgi:hypothetical protein
VDPRGSVGGSRGCVPYVERHGTLVRRVLMPKTLNHVYFEIDDKNGGS